MTALEVDSLLTVENGSVVNTTTSLFAATYFNSQTKGSKKASPRDFNPYSSTLFLRESKRKIDKNTAKKLLELIKADKLPNWVLMQIEHEKEAVYAVATEGENG